MIGALGDPSAAVRRQAAQGLGALKARGAVPALRRALEDEDGSVRRAAEYALRKIGDEARQ